MDQQPQPRKRHRKLLWAVIGLVVLLVIIVAAATAGGSNKGTTTTVPVAASSQTTTTTTVAASITSSEITSTTGTTAAAAAKKWVTVATLSGKTDKRGDTFALSGAKARLTYKITSSSMPVCSIYLMAEGTSLAKDGGFPEVMVTDAGSDQTILAKDAGNYYLDVSAANCTWSVTIEEEQ